MAEPIKVADLANKLRTSVQITPPAAHESSQKLARLLRFPEQLRVELERDLDGLCVVVTTQHHVIVKITSHPKQA